MHWPQAMKGDEWVPKDQSPTFVETWKEMEKLLQGGKCRSIGWVEVFMGRREKHIG